MSVVDPATFLSLTRDVQVDHGRKLLVLKSLASDLQIGLIVDHVFGLRTVSGTAIQPTTGTMHDTVTPYLTSICEIGEKMFVVLNGVRLLNALSEAFVEP